MIVVFVSGREMSISVYRNQQLVTMITNEKHYQFDSPYLYSFSDPITIRLGDEIRTQCVYDSTSGDNVTISGSDYVQEMCFGYLTFYLKNALPKAVLRVFHRNHFQCVLRSLVSFINVTQITIYFCF